MRIRFLLKVFLFLLVFFLIDRGAGLLLRAGLERYFGLSQPCDILFIGNSHTVLGINKTLTGKILERTVAIYARQGADIADREVMLRQYFERFPASRPVVVYDVSARLFNSSGLSENSYLLFYPFIKEPLVSHYIRELEPHRDLFFLRQTVCLSRYDDVTLRFAIRGIAGRWDNLKSTHIDPGYWNSESLALRYPPIHISTQQLSLFYKTLSYFDSLGIQVELLYLPNAPVLTETDTAGYNNTLRIFSACEEKYSTVHFLNYNLLFAGESRYFYDPIHLNADGQSEFTRTLASELRKQLSMQVKP